METTSAENNPNCLICGESYARHRKSDQRCRTPFGAWRQAGDGTYEPQPPFVQCEEVDGQGRRCLLGASHSKKLCCQFSPGQRMTIAGH